MTQAANGRSSSPAQQRAALRWLASAGADDPAFERTLRAVVGQLGACLGALPAPERQLLTLRAGIGRAPLSLQRAAAKLHLPVAKARARQRSALLDLGHLAGPRCQMAAAIASAPPIVVATAIPALESPIAIVTQGAAPLTSPRALAHPRQGVEAATASSAPPAPGPRTIALAGVTAPALARPGTSALTAALWVLAAAAICGLALMALAARRRSRHAYAYPAVPMLTAAAPPPIAARDGAEPVQALQPQREASAASAAEPWPPAEPSSPEAADGPWLPPVPTTPAPPAHGAQPASSTDLVPVRPAASRPSRRAARSAAVVASGLLSLVLRRMLRRRGR